MATPYNRAAFLERLEAAFADLEEKDVLIGRGETCCGTCGHGDMEDMGEAGQPYTFYSVQDRDRMDDSGVSRDILLYLAYGVCGGNDDDALAFADDLCAILRAYGFTVVWNGQINTRVGIYVA